MAEKDIPVSEQVIDVKLPARLGLDQAAWLVETFREAGDAPIRFDASEVSLVGGPCLQALLAAARQRRGDGDGIEIVEASTTFQESLAILGVDLSSFPALEIRQ